MGLLYTNYQSNSKCSPVTNNSLNINAVSGTLTKTFNNSFFKRFEKDSYCEKIYFREDKPSRIISKREKGCINDREQDEEYYDGYYYKLKEIIVLQVMILPNNNYLVEAIDKENYDAIFENEVLGDDDSGNN